MYPEFRDMYPEFRDMDADFQKAIIALKLTLDSYSG